MQNATNAANAMALGKNTTNATALSKMLILQWSWGMMLPMPRIWAQCYQYHGPLQNATNATAQSKMLMLQWSWVIMLPIPRPFTKYYKCHGSKQNATSLLSCLKRRIDVTRQVMSTFLFFFCFFLNGFCGAGIGINFRTSPEPHQ